MPQRPVFRSPLTTVLTMIGVSVGLGNVWRFPYMMGQYGGSAFLFTFLFFVFMLGIPAVMGEWALGRAARRGPLGAFQLAFGRRGGRVIGSLLMLTVFVANSYYLLVIAYIVYSAGFSALRGFNEQSMPAFEAGLANAPLQYAISLILLCLCGLVLVRGLNRGIEKVSAWCMPLFGVAVIILIARALSLDGAMTHLAAFLKPDFSVMLQGSNLLAAMGQVFFSLSLGGTFFVIYGSYLPERTHLAKPAILTGLGDTAAALLAALFIVPATLVFGLEPDQGPGLIFDTLPRLFTSLPGGRVLAPLFLTGLGLAAFLSSLAALQVLVGGLRDHLQWTPAKAVLTVGVLEALMILPTAINPNLIGHLDLIFGSGMQCLGGALALLALGFGLGRRRALQELFGDRHLPWQPAFLFWLRWVIPGCLLLTLFLYMMNQLS